MTHLVAWDAKPFRLLSDRRTLEKLTLHRDYCEHVGIPHYIFTERSVPKTVLRNIDLIRGARPRELEGELLARRFATHVPLLTQRLQEASRRALVWHVCARYDADHRVCQGTAIRIFYWLVWTKKLWVNLNTRQLYDLPVSAVRLPQSRGRRHAV